MDRRRMLASLAPLMGASAALAQGRTLGEARRPYGSRAPGEERSNRLFVPSATPGIGSSRTPLQDQVGIITPSSLHFERHHSGVPAIDVATHQLLVHGMVQHPLCFSMEELRRMPSVSRIHFVECAGNNGREQAGNAGATAQISHGLASCSEWTGVPLRELLQTTGLQSDARWVVA